jgi:HTH-type transcriptional regulator / antitoxin HigA
MIRMRGRLEEAGMATETRALNEAYFDLVRELPLRPLRSEEDLSRAIAMLDRLMDRGASSRSEDETDYMLVLGSLVEEYENIHWPMPSELEERELLRAHHEAWLARNPEPTEESA